MRTQRPSQAEYKLPENYSSQQVLTQSDSTVTITSGDGGDSASILFYENALSDIIKVQATSSNGSPITYSIVGGADSARFSIHAATGALSFVWGASPDYEAPGDADGDNYYQVIVAASDGTGVDQQALTVRVLNVNEAPVFTSFGGAASANLSVAENNIVAATVAAVDPEGLSSLSYAFVGGTDAALFTVNPWNGRIVFRSVPDFEAPGDSDLNNVYHVIVRATDQVNTVTQTLAITVTDMAAESTIKGTSSSNTLTGTSGADVIYGLGGSDTLTGAAGDDVLDGGVGNDILVGGLGADRLLGGTGADHFRFDSLGDSPVGGHDMIFDFVRSQGDKIVLTDIDANLVAAGDQAFTFIGTAAFSGAAGELRYQRSNGDTWIFADVDGDAVADFQLQLNGEITLFATEFLL